MSLTTEHGAPARENPRSWIGREVGDVPAGWIDDMVRRLLNEWNCQMIRLEDATRKTAHGDVDARRREQDARTLAALRRQLKDIVLMEDDRAVKRAARTAQSDEDAVAALERRLDQLLEREKQAGVSRQP